MKTKHLAIATLLMLVAVSSQAQFTLKGQFRNRTELTPSKAGRNALQNEDANSYLSTWQRSRITAHYKAEKLETNISFQDVRGFDGEDAMSGTGNTAIALHEAWAKYYFNENIGLKIGRQELAFGDARLLWNRNWNHYAFAYDAFSFEGKSEKVNWTAGMAFNSLDERGAYDGYKRMGFAHVSFKLSDAFTLNFTDLYVNNEVDESAELDGSDLKIYYYNKIGLNPVVKAGALTFNGSFYYQMGKQTADIDYAGMMYAADLSYKLNDKMSISVGYENYSGEDYDDDQSDNKNKNFSSVPFGAGHKYFDLKDMHLNMMKTGRGAQDIYLKINTKLNKKTSLMVGYHNTSFSAQNAYFDGTDNVEFKSVGSSVDLQAKIGLGKGMGILAGYSVLLPTEDYVNSKLGMDVNAKFHQFAFVMFTFKPTFLKTEKK